jgi:hypothetical protein
VLGAPDPLYVAARRVLLDALTALREHRDAIVLVGAQAVYVHAGEADLAVAPFTTDGDLAIDPRRLAPKPLIELALDQANFRLAEGKIGSWEVSVNVEGIPRIVAVDLLVPESLGGAGRRGARIPPHATAVARKASGLEATLVDRNLMTIGALDPEDRRHVDVAIAGPSALIVAKVHKILDRVDSRDRLSDKDALDVYRLLRAVPTPDLARRIAVLLADDVSRRATERAVMEFPRLFGSAIAAGSQMAARAAGNLENSETLSASLATLAGDLIAILSRTSGDS